MRIIHFLSENKYKIVLPILANYLWINNFYHQSNKINNNNFSSRLTSIHSNFKIENGIQILNKVNQKLQASKSLLKFLKIKTTLCFEHPVPNNSDDKSINNRYTYDQVKMHGANSTDGYWVIYKDKVYDITEFIEYHPGGKIIMKAVGGHLDPFFDIYKFHQTPEILEFLDPYNIGTVDSIETYQAMKTQLTNSNIANPFQNEPDRDSRLNAISTKPFNAETPPELLYQNFITPTDIFFVRNHLPVTIVDATFNHIIEVCMEEKFLKPEYKNTFKQYESKDSEKLYCKDLTLEALKNNFEQRTVTACIQCAGNRRSEMNSVESVKGLQWTGGGIGNANWTGVPFKSIFKMYGFNFDKYNDYSNLDIHVKFRGNDVDHDSDCNYETSIQLFKALDPDTILATDMNSNVLPIDHGFPARAIVPGYCGARNVKWVNRITISSEESKSRWQKDDYKVIPGTIKFGDNVDFDQYQPIHSTPVTSYICSPLNNSKLLVGKNTDTIKVSGYAFSGCGNAIKNVYVSIDDGVTWIPAQIYNNCKNKHRCWSWTLWNVDIPLTTDQKKLNIICRAVDVASNSQPEDIEPLWNMRGLLNNAWNRVSINFEHEK